MTQPLQVIPDLESFREYAAAYAVVPVTARIVTDRDTPVTVYEKLVGDGIGFLLESADGGEQWGRWSFVGWDPAFTLVSRDGKSSVDRDDIEIPAGDPLEVLEALIARFDAPDWPGLPPLHSGAVGSLAYDAVRYVENLPNQPTDDRQLPTSLWMFVGALAAFDRVTQSVTVIRNVFIDPSGRWAKHRGSISDGDFRHRSRHRPAGGGPLVQDSPAGSAHDRSGRFVSDDESN